MTLNLKYKLCFCLKLYILKLPMYGTVNIKHLLGFEVSISFNLYYSNYSMTAVVFMYVTFHSRSIELKLRPDESPYISFRADIPKLREGIFNFGRIDSRGLPIETAFADPDMTSQCLPNVFEDYGDAEHHILYKTVEEIKKTKHNDTSVSDETKHMITVMWFIKANHYNSLEWMRQLIENWLSTRENFRRLTL